jgi:hypothetical protein
MVMDLPRAGERPVQIRSRQSIQQGSVGRRQRAGLNYALDKCWRDDGHGPKAPADTELFREVSHEGMTTCSFKSAYH